MKRSSRVRRAEYLLLFGSIAGSVSSACGLLSADDFAGLHARDEPERGGTSTAGGADVNNEAGAGAGNDASIASAGSADETRVASAGRDGHATSSAGNADEAGAESGGSAGAPSAGSAGEAGAPSAGGAGGSLPVLETCAPDPGAVEARAGSALTSLSLEDFGGWAAIPDALPDSETFIFNPAIASRSASSVYVFSPASSGKIWQNLGVAQLGSSDIWTWRGWTALRAPPGWVGGVAATAFGEQGLALAARGVPSNADALVYARVCFARNAAASPGALAGTWSDWVQVKQGNLKRDAAIAFSDPGLFIVASGTNDRVYLSAYDVGAPFDSDDWSDWGVIDNTTTWASSPAIAARPGGTLFVAAKALDAHYYLTKSYDFGGDWSPWVAVDSGGLAFESAPALATAPTSDGALIIVGVGADDQMWISVSRDDGLTWSKFQAPLGASLLGAAAAVSPTEGVIHTFGRGTNNEIYIDPYQSR